MKAPSAILFFVMIVSLTASITGSAMMVSLRALREEALFTDLAIVSNDAHEYPCHAVVLAAYCDYFRKMLLSGMQESQGKSIKVDVSGDAVDIILGFIYDAEKSKFDSEEMPVSRYMELRRFAAQSFARNLEAALNKVFIDIPSAKTMEAIEEGLLHSDNHLLMQIFDDLSAKTLNDDFTAALITHC